MKICNESRIRIQSNKKQREENSKKDVQNGLVHVTVIIRREKQSGLLTCCVSTNRI